MSSGFRANHRQGGVGGAGDLRPYSQAPPRSGCPGTTGNATSFRPGAPTPEPKHGCGRLRRPATGCQLASVTNFPLRTPIHSPHVPEARIAHTLGVGRAKSAKDVASSPRFHHVWVVMGHGGWGGRGGQIVLLNCRRWRQVAYRARVIPRLASAPRLAGRSAAESVESSFGRHIDVEMSIEDERRCAVRASGAGEARRQSGVQKEKSAWRAG